MNSYLIHAGSPEFIVFNSIPTNDGIAVGDLNKAAGDVAKIGLGQCMKNKWVKKDGDKIVANNQHLLSNGMPMN